MISTLSETVKIHERTQRNHAAEMKKMQGEETNWMNRLYSLFTSATPSLSYCSYLVSFGMPLFWGFQYHAKNIQGNLVLTSTCSLWSQLNMVSFFLYVLVNHRCSLNLILYDMPFALERDFDPLHWLSRVEHGFPVHVIWPLHARVLLWYVSCPVSSSCYICSFNQSAI